LHLVGLLLILKDSLIPLDTKAVSIT